jgi:hypothetical protein
MAVKIHALGSIEADGLHLERNFPLARLAIDYVLETQHFGATKAAKADRLRHLSFLRSM